MSHEEWRSISGYDGCYLISSLGRIMRVKRAPGTRPGKIIKPCPDTHGYMRVSLSSGNKNYPKAVHILMADAFFEEPRDGKHVNHIDADKTNNRLDNLELVSRRENVDHAVRLGRYGNVRGRVLNEEQVIQIKGMLAKKVPMNDIAKQYGVSRHAIYSINCGRSWKSTG